MDSHFYATHGALSDPGAGAARLAGLPGEVGALCEVVQGLLIHDHYGLELYGDAPAELHQASRETLPVAERLDAILAENGTMGAPGGLAPRAPFERAVGTCRDFALLLCALLRQQGRAARVRCGFADYFQPGLWEDHWLCEIWEAAEGRWRLADAQLDAEHRLHLAIDFDPADLPEGRFLRAWQAWQRCRSGQAELESFGHGDEGRGAWFVGVNLARDLLALRKQEVSAWDGWRAAGPEARALDEGVLGACDRLAALAESAPGPAPPDEAEAGLRHFLATPPWSRG